MKNNTTQTQQNEIKIKEKKNQDSITYIGNVTILYQTKKGRYRHIRKKNMGQMPLFNFITRALQGVLYRDLIPKYLEGFIDDGSPAFIQKIPAINAGIRYNSDDENRSSDPIESDIIEYPFILPISNITTNSNITKLALYNYSNAKCAEISIENAPISKASAGSSNILVYWRLKFISSSEGITEENEEDFEEKVVQNNGVEQIS